MNLLYLAISPTLTSLFYIYIRDKYEKEPFNLLFGGTLYGIIISFPIIFTENFIAKFENYFIYDIIFNQKVFTSFFVASFVEEFYKYIFIYFLIWRNKNFNEPFDGIVYSSFISLGFAGVENILYVFNPNLGGVYTGIARCIISVPAHLFFAIFMGYYFSEAKFYNFKFSKTKAYFVPFILHGLYDLLLISNFKFNEVLFILFFIYLWISSFKKIKKCLKDSPFKKD